MHASRCCPRTLYFQRAPVLRPPPARLAAFVGGACLLSLVFSQGPSSYQAFAAPMVEDDLCEVLTVAEAQLRRVDSSAGVLPCCSTASPSRSPSGDRSGHGRQLPGRTMEFVANVGAVRRNLPSNCVEGRSISACISVVATTLR